MIKPESVPTNSMTSKQTICEASAKAIEYCDFNDLRFRKNRKTDRIEKPQFAFPLILEITMAPSNIPVLQPGW